MATAAAAFVQTPAHLFSSFSSSSTGHVFSSDAVIPLRTRSTHGHIPSSSSSFIPSLNFSLSSSSTTSSCQQLSMNTGAPLGGKGKKPSRNRRMRNAKSSSNPSSPASPSSGKTKLEPETIFIETPPSRLELVIPTISILTVIGIFPFVGSVARALWVRYKITSRRISIASGFQGKDTTEIIYRDIAFIKYVRRLGDSADCVVTLKDGAKLEIRSMPKFDSVYEYILEKLDESAREESGPA